MDNLEDYFREHKNEFDNASMPNDNGHFDRFLHKLNLRIREYVSILPHLIKVAIATVIIFIASIIIWNNYIRKDRHEVTLKQKIENAFTTIKGKR